MIQATAAQATANPLTTHFWHGVEALAFLLICVGGLAIGEWRQQRQHRQAATAEGSRDHAALDNEDCLAAAAEVQLTSQSAPNVTITSRGPIIR